MNNVAKLIIAVAVPIVIGGLSGFATARGVSTWYPTLVKPSVKGAGHRFPYLWTDLWEPIIEGKHLRGLPARFCDSGWFDERAVLN